MLQEINGSKHEEELRRKSREQEVEDMRKILESPMINGDRILLMLQEIWMRFGLYSAQVKINVFFDNGSTCSLVLTSLAEEYKLLSQDIRVTITTIDSEKERQTKMYMVELVNQSGESRMIRAIGVDKISGEIPTIKVDGVKQFFSEKLQQQWGQVNKRPEGQIQLLVGSEVASIHPVKLEAVEDLIISVSVRSRVCHPWPP